MKVFLAISLSLFQFTAFASRSPEVFCVSVDGALEAHVFRDAIGGRVAELRAITGLAQEKVLESAVVKKEAHQTAYYLGRKFSLSVDLTKATKDGFRGYLNLSRTSYAEPVKMLCRF